MFGRVAARVPKVMAAAEEITDALPRQAAAPIVLLLALVRVPVLPFLGQSRVGLSLLVGLLL